MSGAPESKPTRTSEVEEYLENCDRPDCVLIKPLKKLYLNEIFNEDAQSVLRYLIAKAIFSQPELVIGQKSNPIQVPKEHIEQWMVQSLGVAPVGKGSYPVDIIDIDRHYAADAKMLSWSGGNSLSGETSLTQNFKDAGNDLDLAFKNGNFSGVVEDWSQLLEKKYKTVFNDYKEVENIYYFFILRDKNNFHLCGMEIDTTSFNLLEVDRVSKEGTSIFLKNLIHDRYGQSKIYKSKKRLELRLKPKNWIEDNLVITFDNTDIEVQSKNLKGADRNDLYKHSSQEWDKIFQESMKK